MQDLTWLLFPVDLKGVAETYTVCLFLDSDLILKMTQILIPPPSTQNQTKHTQFFALKCDQK